MKFNLFTLLSLAVAAASALQKPLQSHLEPSDRYGRNESLRPLLHFSPPQGWMGYPCGLFLDDHHKWHLYYLYNPDGIDPEDGDGVRWGHATSRDLFHWADQDVALSREGASQSIWQGSVVVDVNNTSGFFPSQSNGVVAIYSQKSAHGVTQAIAYSTDGGYSFKRPSEERVMGLHSQDLVDPKVTWHAESQKWVMVLARVHQRSVVFYTSFNLQQWSFASNFELPGAQDHLESPNLVALTVEGTNELVNVLTFSTWAYESRDLSQSFYVTGHFNGSHFKSGQGAEMKPVATGMDTFAEQFSYGSEFAISIAWAGNGNHDYMRGIPSGPKEGWTGTLGLPRRHHLVGSSPDGDAPRTYQMVATPHGLERMVDVCTLSCPGRFPGGDVECDWDLRGSSWYIDITITSSLSTGPETFTEQDDPFLSNMTFVFSTSTGESVRGGLTLDFGAKYPTFWIDGTKARSWPQPEERWRHKDSKLIKGVDGMSHLELIIDRSVLDYNIHDGLDSGTMLLFPDEPMESFTWDISEISPWYQVTMCVHPLFNAFKSSGAEDRELAATQEL